MLRCDFIRNVLTTLENFTLLMAFFSSYIFSASYISVYYLTIKGNKHKAIYTDLKSIILKIKKLKVNLKRFCIV